MRDDLKFAAFAVAHGFSLHTDRNGHRGAPLSPNDISTGGIPHDGLQFHLGAWRVWDTARGWRCSPIREGRHLPPAPEEFHKRLLPALEAAIAGHAADVAARAPDLCACQDCDWQGDVGACAEISDVLDRVNVGEIFPAGECPECGALAHLVD